MAKFLSIIIPTYKRPKKLKDCLDSLDKQTLQSYFYEIIAIEDKKQEGPAAIRNMGIKKAKGDILLFLNDDVVCDMRLLKEHFFFHKLNPQESIACLGNVKWPDSLEKSRFLDWVDKSGFQFSLKGLKNRQKVNYKRFYTINISVKTNYLLKHGLFDKHFPYPCLEDIELGYRLSQKGLIIIFNQKAVVYHNHQPIFEDFLARAKKIGLSARILVNKHPQLKNKIVPTHLSWQEKIRMLFWQIASIPGRPLKYRKIVFENYRRQILKAIQKAYFSTSLGSS